MFRGNQVVIVAEVSFLVTWTVERLLREIAAKKGWRGRVIGSSKSSRTATGFQGKQIKEGLGKLYAMYIGGLQDTHSVSRPSAPRQPESSTSFMTNEG